MGLTGWFDTNFILGLLKSNPETLSMISNQQIDTRRCRYSVITRMELPGLTAKEEALIGGKLACLGYLALTTEIEDTVIRSRCCHCMKLPDAIIAASALTCNAQLLTHDKILHSLVTGELTNRKGLC